MRAFLTERRVGDVICDLDRVVLLVREDGARRVVARLPVVQFLETFTGAIGECQAPGPDAATGRKVFALQGRSIVQDRRKRLFGGFQNSPVLIARRAPN